MLKMKHIAKITDGKHDATDPILSLRGVGKEIWKDEGADEYVERLRRGWGKAENPEQEDHTGNPLHPTP